MLSHCLKSREKRQSKNQKVGKTNTWKLMILSKYSVLDNKKS